VRDLFERIPEGQSMTTMYGIKNCDTIKKARTWLEDRGIAYTFHDYKAEGIDEARLRRWCAEKGWEVLLNRAGTTFRNLPDADRVGLDLDKAVALMQRQPSMIKRPVVEAGDSLLVGFKPDAFAAAFAS
jgi:arsenate reductase